MYPDRLSRIERWWWLGKLGAVGVIAMVAGWTTSSMLANALTPDAREVRARRASIQPTKPRRPAGLRSSDAAVTRRNPFCSVCRPRPAQAPGPDARDAPRLDDAVLLATHLAPGDGDWTLAAVRFRGAGQLRMLGRGSEVSGARITRVTATQLEFVRDGRRGILHLFPGLAAPAPPPNRTPKQAAPRGCPSTIRRRGPGRYSIDRALLSKLVGGLGGTTHDVAVAPLEVGGRLAGLRVVRVRRGSVFHCLGLRPRDQITAVNNQQLTSPDVLLTLLAQLPGARHVSVSVTRDGRMQSLDYSIE